MNKKLFLPVALIALVCASVVAFKIYPSLFPQLPEMTTYENSRYSFRVDYPADWVLGEPPTNNDGRTFTSADGAIECHAYGFFNALTDDAGNPQTLDEFIDWLAGNERLETSIIEKNKMTFAGGDAYELITGKVDGSITQAVYTLGTEDGYGFLCSFPDIDAQKDFRTTFDHMVASFERIDETSTLDHGAVSCEALLSGAVTPFADVQTFLDENYTEVTITSRDAWDQDRLPQRVLDLESQNYTCYPMPFEMGDTDQPAGMHVEPAVVSVEWTCELEHTDYQYVSLEENQKVENLQTQGYTCVKEDCFIENNQASLVWLCAK